MNDRHRPLNDNLDGLAKSLVEIEAGLAAFAQGPFMLNSGRQRREQVGQLLRQAFPLGEGGAFTTLLESIQDNKPSARR